MLASSALKETHLGSSKSKNFGIWENILDPCSYRSFEFTYIQLFYSPSLDVILSLLSLINLQPYLSHGLQHLLLMAFLKIWTMLPIFVLQTFIIIA